MTSLFAWLEVIEKEFDKAFVDLDLILGDIDSEQIDLTYDGRQKMTALSAAFAQLCHKSQTIFQMNAKLEAQLLNMRTDLCEVQASKAVLESEVHRQLLNVHSVQLELATLRSGSQQNPDSQEIMRRLEGEMDKFAGDKMRECRLAAELDQVKVENSSLRQSLYSLQSEVFGARLAAKYLDKELAGRIQQIQLLGRDLRGSEHDKLWNQLEAEIHLHRHKTVIRACRGRGSSISAGGSGASGGQTAANGVLDNNLPRPQDYTMDKKRRGIGDIRVVKLRREPTEGLGISITGGKEHGVPILISEIHANLPAERCNQLFVGDAILSVNGINLRDAKHNDAVNVLSRQTGDLTFEVVFVSPEDSDDEDEHSSVNYYDTDKDRILYPASLSATSPSVNGASSAANEGHRINDSNPSSPMSVTVSRSVNAQGASGSSREPQRNQSLDSCSSTGGSGAVPALTINVPTINGPDESDQGRAGAGTPPASGHSSSSASNNESSSAMSPPGSSSGSQSQHATGISTRHNPPGLVLQRNSTESSGFDT
ncbi:Golgi-associated PDZ and coiled-coil motif-containing protein-like isoform X1 [Convolutriloba macropyga]|uniref:Golgi-associated PDZ and coiled-coil motif-containing protein-like isoform X1 n=1 Tax=Convolutriloba macropyga TaxID=536237 RepID=UPI003F524A32